MTFIFEFCMLFVTIGFLMFLVHSAKHGKGLTINLVLKVEEPPKPVYTPVAEPENKNTDVDFEQSQYNIMRAAQTIQELFLDDSQIYKDPKANPARKE